MDNPTVIALAGVVISALISFLIASMKIGEYRNKVDTATNDIDKLEKEVKELRDIGVECRTTLKERAPLTTRKSPIELSERGKVVLKDSGGESFVDSNYTELKALVEAKTPETAYDIQEAAKAVIEEIKDDRRLNPMKEYLFHEGMAIEDLFVVLGIHLRNLVLKEKGIETTEIDKSQK